MPEHFTSVGIGIAADGTVPEDAGMQAKLAWQNLQAQLRAAGMTIETLLRPPRLCPMRLTLPLYGWVRGSARLAQTRQHIDRRRSCQSRLEG